MSSKLFCQPLWLLRTDGANIFISILEFDLEESRVGCCLASPGWVVSIAITNIPSHCESSVDYPATKQCALFSRAGRLADGPQPGQVREYEKLHESILYAELRVGVRDEREGREGGQVPRLGFYVLGVTGASDSQPE